MERDRLSPERYSYLSKEDSDLYDAARLGDLDLNECWLIIMKLLEDKAKVCALSHSHYMTK